ncbi:regulator of PEP synthase PpsR (kinase-PPPase family) [Natronocella acetinitrilica]|uniref:Putative phosphoenolpyruvate synthase regulatory protein n=1 Tax=Natronocella acetinitrilica TaxID=414046 RepID=A0AAE3KDF8_9GAMM|nr:pyruvate, water dikinase regulatory protein [Natronocella acetinitrilica]MCP1676233.1 regulator of PEP synthase PpsR (kinase-PPPase family) [Natronocella acetinitrilica]
MNSETRKRTVFYISDRTGITAETLGQSLMTQFDIDFEQVTLPFVDSVERAEKVVEQINRLAVSGAPRPIVFSTVVQDDVREYLRKSSAAFFDFFDAFIAPLESELAVKSSHAIGQAHGVGNRQNYDVRIDAINYALSHDDGATTRHYDRADIIIIGVSRTGKTPVSLYLALQYGIFAANYPLTEDDIMESGLPRLLQPFRQKLYGLSIAADRLRAIRNERRPNSRYASIQQCQLEVLRAEGLFGQNKIPFLNSTSKSIEEIASTIIHAFGLRRRVH